jgi:uncharacterized membrane protein YhhN
MTPDFVLRGSIEWTILFFVLVAVAVFTQLTKKSITKFIPGLVRHFIKASPALFLAALSCYVYGPILVTLGFLFCGLGDILLDIPEEKSPFGFELGAVSFAAALVCLSVVYIGNRIEGHPILPLALTNTLIAIFVLRWVFPKLKKGVGRGLEVVYFSILIISNIIASTTSVPIFLGSSLWLMSDLSIGLSSHIIEVPANSLDTLGLYDLGLYFLAVGLLAGAA